MKNLIGSFLVVISFIVASTLGQTACAEVFRNVYPSTQPGDLSRLFPGTTIETTQLGNQNPERSALVLKGGGLDGWLVIEFHDLLKSAERVARNNPNDEFSQRIFARQKSGEDKRYRLTLVLWIPTDHIPVATLYKLYGKQATKEINKNTFEEMHLWEKSGVVAVGKNGLVTRIEYHHTFIDVACESYLIQGISCPDKVKRKAEKDALMWGKVGVEWEKQNGPGSD